MTYDALVVGGGILGCSTAWELAARGLKVLVIEREHTVGHGSTSRSTAIIRQRYSHRAAMALALEGLRTWERWSETVPPTSTAATPPCAKSESCFSFRWASPAPRPSPMQCARWACAWS